MGRFSSRPASEFPQQMQNGQPVLPPDWPTVFPKPVIGVERDGVIVRETGDYITSPSQVEIVPESLQAIRMMRVKGHRFVILNDQPGINTGRQTMQQVESVNQHLMQLFGQAGIFSIDGLYYSTSNLKDDEYAKPNIGMFKRAEREMQVDFSKGWFVGTKIEDLKAAQKAGAVPVLIKIGQGENTLEKLNTFANKSLLKSTKVFNSLLEFAETLT